MSSKFNQSMRFGAGLLIAPLIYVAVFRLQFFADIGILFYRGLCLAALTAALHALLLFVFRSLRHGSMSVLVSSVLFGFAVNVLFLLLFPVTFQRSVTIFLMRQLQARHEEPISIPDLERVFIEKYVLQNGGVRTRVEEQLQSGNIESTPSGYRLTNQGRKFLLLGEVIERVLGLSAAEPQFPPAPDSAANR